MAIDAPFLGIVVEETVVEGFAVATFAGCDGIDLMSGAVFTTGFVVVAFFFPPLFFPRSGAYA